MKVYCLKAGDGSEWFAFSESAKKRALKLQMKAIGQRGELGDYAIEEHDIPEGRLGLVYWLNRHFANKQKLPETGNV